MPTGLMVLHGGPFDGTSQPVKDGWPAPDGYCHRSIEGGGEYSRFHTDSEGRHHYRWRAAPPESQEER